MYIQNFIHSVVSIESLFLLEANGFLKNSDEKVINSTSF